MCTSSWMPISANVVDDNGFSMQPKCVIRIVSYNILAQAYVRTSKFPTSPLSSLRWDYRSKAVMAQILSLNADILCLQELDEFHTFYKDALHKENYEGVYIQRGNRKQDGCGIFFRHSKVSLIAKEAIDYNDLVPPQLSDESEVETIEVGNDKVAQKRGDMRAVRAGLKRDSVGIIVALRLVEVPTQILVLANTHIHWDPVLMDVKLAQVQYLAQTLVAFRRRVLEEFGIEPLLLVAGDFNSLPGDTVYNYITSGFNESVKNKAFEENLGVKATLDGLLECDPKEKKLTSGLCQEELGWGMRLKEKYPLPLVSLYAYADKEPPATNYTHNFVGTLDYIFFIPSRHLEPRSLLLLPPRDAPTVATGLPNDLYPSDHLPIGSDFGIY